jgi:tRNA pseudouridine38-40 synthase
MPRYFLEVSYKGTAYAGFQIQQNANTIQAEIEKALQIYFKQVIALTGSSRTDAGVHAKQNYFQFDIGSEITAIEKSLYHLNAILPNDIFLRNLLQVEATKHCRFDATSRTYDYTITINKNPFLIDFAHHYPYPLNFDALQACATMLLSHTDYESFAKKNSQNFTNICTIMQSNWQIENEKVTFTIQGNRFLRGMVRGLVGTMLLVGRGKYSVADFKAILESNNTSKTDFSAPAHGLMLMKVAYDFI